MQATHPPSIFPFQNTPQCRIPQKSIAQTKQTVNMAEAWTEADYEAALAKLEALTDKVNTPCCPGSTQTGR